jgi:hypothetical protein
MPTKRKGGVLQDDWKTPQTHKLLLIAAAHPNPTRWAPAGCEVFPQSPSPEEAAYGSSSSSGGHKAVAAVGRRLQEVALGAAEAVTAAVAPAAAAAAQPQQQPSREVLVSDGLLTVSKVNSWVEGGLPCVQYDLKVG